MTDPNPGVIYIGHEVMHDLLRLPEALRVTDISLVPGMVCVAVEGPWIKAPVDGKPAELRPIYKILDDGHVVLDFIRGYYGP